MTARGIIEILKSPIERLGIFFARILKEKVKEFL